MLKLIIVSLCQPGATGNNGPNCWPPELLNRVAISLAGTPGICSGSASQRTEGIGCWLRPCSGGGSPPGGTLMRGQVLLPAAGIVAASPVHHLHPKESTYHTSKPPEHLLLLNMIEFHLAFKAPDCQQYYNFGGESMLGFCSLHASLCMPLSACACG